MKTSFRAVIGALALGAFGLSQAAVINHSDVGGWRTFQDTQTGRIWLDLDSFTNASHYLLNGIASTDDMRAAVAGAGFVAAREADVRQLLGGVQLQPSNSLIWSNLESILASNAGGTYYGSQYGLNEEVLAGFMLDDNSNSIFLAVGRETQPTWAFGSPGGNYDNMTFPANSYMGYGLWAYFDENSGPNLAVPEPGSLLLVGLGLMMATAAPLRRRRRR